jgi:hypothetical protein
MVPPMIRTATARRGYCIHVATAILACPLGGALAGMVVAEVVAPLVLSAISMERKQ